jgi:hypothetical protein
MGGPGSGRKKGSKNKGPLETKLAKNPRLLIGGNAERTSTLMTMVDKMSEEEKQDLGVILREYVPGEEYVTPTLTVTADDIDVVVQSKGGGPHSKLTVARVQAMVDAVIGGMSNAQAALLSDIDERTMYRWLDTYPAFANIFAKARAIRTRSFAQRAIAVAGENPFAWITLLQRTDPENWSEKQRLEVKHTVTGGVDVNHFLKDARNIELISELEQRMQSGGEIIEGEILPGLPEHSEGDST